MEMLKILTQKLSQQSLNEGQQAEPSKMWMRDAQSIISSTVKPVQSDRTLGRSLWTGGRCLQAEEDRDSGTESDEENAELEALEQAMLEQQENQENKGVGCMMRSPPRCAGSPLHTLTKKPLQLLQQPVAILGRSDLHSTHSSPQGSSDFERCSLDYDPASSNEFDRPSSEEELTGINCPVREKRTWSQANHCSSCEPYGSGSSDEEVKDLLCCTQPVLFSSSPPKGVPRFSKPLSPRVFLAKVSPNCSSSVSPRKRHRQTLSKDVSDSSTVIQRPCIDFEKMQASGSEFVFTPYPNLLVTGSRFAPLCPIALR